MRRVLCALLFIVNFVAVFCDVADRKITITNMPDCHSYAAECAIAEEKGYVVVFATAYAKGDSLLYAFSNIGMPTVAVLRVTDVTDEHPVMHFNWTKLVNESSLEDAITVDDPADVVYRVGMAFPRLIEYNDVGDDADLQQMASKPNNASYWNIRDFSIFDWVLDQSALAQNSFVLTATSEHGSPIDTNSTGNWSISFKFTVQGDSGRASESPSLKYGANETQFDFVISNFTPSYASSRFAVETIFVSQSGSDMKVETLESIDDEYSPGVFQIINWLSNPSERQSSGYIQWKPVCYYSGDRSRSSATKVKNYNLSDLKQQENSTRYLNSSIVLSVFGAELYDEQNVTIRAMNISFGLSQDNFYVSANYTAWSAAIGFGAPPEDTISMTVIITISAGLGLPVVILIFGGIYTCVKKRRSKRSEYEPIVDRNQPIIKTAQQ